MINNMVTKHCNADACQLRQTKTTPRTRIKAHEKKGVATARTGIKKLRQDHPPEHCWF